MTRPNQPDMAAHIESLQTQLAGFNAANASMCSYWPIAKTVLTMLQGLASSYPTVVTAISALVAAGNAVCPSVVTKEALLTQLKKDGITDLDGLASELARRSSAQAGMGTASAIIISEFIYNQR